MKKNKVNLFLVGAAKAGTTSMYNYLKNSDNLFCPDLKEPWYFTDIMSLTKFDRVKSLEEYERLYDLENPYRYYLDASVSYLSYYDVAKQIHDYNPNSKIIIMLRDPIKRLISYYKMYSKRQGLNISLKEFIDNTETALPKLETGLYYERVKAYKDLFGSNVQVIIFEELIENPIKVQEELNGFLGLEDLNFDITKKYNQSKEEKSKIISKFIHKDNLLKSVLKVLVSSRKVRQYVKQIILKMNEKPNIISVEIDDETHSCLVNYYSNNVAELENLLGLKITYWDNFN